MSTSTARTRAQRILVGSATPSVRAVLLDQDGEPVTTGTFTIDVRDVDGTISGTTDRAAAYNSTNERWEASLTTAEAAALTIWRVEWKSGGSIRATTYHRIVGGFMFSTAELQERPGMANRSPGDLATARDWITDLIERETGVAWSPRFDVEHVYLEHARDRHVLPYRMLRSLTQATIDGEVLTAGDLADLRLRYDAGVVLGHDYGYLEGECEFRYEHGYDEPTETLRQAALIGAADFLLRSTSSLSERIRSRTNDLGITESFSYPGGDGHATGIDFVDAAIVRHDHRIPHLA